MPSGSYLLSDHDGPYAVETFRCAAGPAGWRYVGTRTDPGGRPLLALDLAVDDRWRAVRLVLTAGGVELRGGMVGPEAVWRCGPDQHAEHAEHTEHAAGFTGDSPAFAVATARLLALEVGGLARLRLVRLSAALGALTVDEGWGRTPDEQGTQRYEAADLGTGARRVVHLAGEVVVDAGGVDLQTLTRA